MRVIFTCGGTAGHINPALALAKAVEARWPGSEILFVGAAGESMEAALVPRAGYPLRQVNINSFRRRLNPEGLAHNLKALKNIGLSQIQCGKILDEFKPDLVVGTGGYASYPVTRMAARRGIPTAIHESNAVAGLTTRRLAKWVDRVMLGLEIDKSLYPHPERVVVTGTPVRPDFYAHTRLEARTALGITDDRPLVLSCWGSLGAADMNRVMVDFLARCAGEGEPFHHIHGCGKQYYDWVLTRLEERGVDLSAHPGLSVREYIYDMPLVMAASDVVLCRAGASTISELTALAKPAILVPSPNVTNDHQTKNALVIADGNGGVLLREEECTPDRLWNEVEELLRDAQRRRDMGLALSRLSPGNAVERILDVLTELVG